MPFPPFVFLVSFCFTAVQHAFRPAPPAAAPCKARDHPCSCGEKSEFRGASDSGPPQHIDMVFLDEEGNTMYAEIPLELMDTKGPLVEEGGIYVISRFRVSNAKSLFRPVAARYMVEFTCHTRISPANDPPPTFPRYAYYLTPFAQLPSYVGENKNFIDVLGVITEVSETIPVHLPSQPNPTVIRNIVLRGLSNYETKLTLWGQRATEFTIDTIYNEAEAKPIVVLFVGNLMKSFVGDEYLSGNAACRWYFNPDIPEALPFYESYQNQRLEIVHIAAPPQQMPQQQPVQQQAPSLKELQDMDPYDFPGGGYRCTVTIARLVPDVSWWFPSCNRCSRSCVPDGAGYKCNSCSCSGFRFKYKLCFIATDGTAEAEMVCFGDLARNIIGKPVQAVLRSARQGDQTPPDITAIVSLKFTFGITMTEQSFYKPDKSYLVTSIIASYPRQRAIPRLPNNQRDPPVVKAVDTRSPGQVVVPCTTNLAMASGSSSRSGVTTEHTPPPALPSEGTPEKTPTSLQITDSADGSSVRKRLFAGLDDDDEIEAADLDLTDAEEDNLAEQQTSEKTVSRFQEKSGGPSVASGQKNKRPRPSRAETHK